MFERPAEAAKWLFEAHRLRQAFAPIPGRRTNDRLTQAYDIQDMFVGMLESKDGEPVGYKIGLTTARMQEMCGIDQPIAGVVLAKRVHHSPAEVDLADFVRLGVECELAVRLSHPPANPGHATVDEIKNAILDVAAAFELVEDRRADYRALDVHSLIADNSWNGGIVLGKPKPLKEVSDLRGVLTINNTVADQGSTRDVLGHPLNAVAWLSRHLADRGKALKSGDWVMTGSVVPTKFANRNDRFVFSIDGLDPAILSVR
jgi:2-keto-4-pentenoate hydratase